MSRRHVDTVLSRRDWLRYGSGLALCGGLGASWLPGLVRAAEESGKKPRKSVIALWMSGGPSQLDTFDPKPGHKNGGPVKAIDTSVPGLQISEYLPQLAKQAHHLALLRSMSTKEGDHGRATYLMRTGYLPQGPVKYPTLGSTLSKELGQAETDLPNFVSISPERFLNPAAFSPGFLGPRFAPLVVGGNTPRGPQNAEMPVSFQVQNINLPADVTSNRFDNRLALWNSFETEFAQSHPGLATQSHLSAYQSAVRMVRSTVAEAFDLTRESDIVRDAYGRSPFGQGCLLARRLVERGVPFVEVSLNSTTAQNGIGWDTHQNNFESVKGLCDVLDPAWATLLQELQDRGLLEHTLIVWMGEFGRTPTINTMNGRDHFPVAWSTVLSGGGVRGGQVIGKTADDGQSVKDRPIAVADLLATVCEAVGVDPLLSNMSNIGRPIRIADPEAKLIEEAFSGSA